MLLDHRKDGAKSFGLRVEKTVFLWLQNLVVEDKKLPTTQKLLKSRESQGCSYSLGAADSGGAKRGGLHTSRIEVRSSSQTGQSEKVTRF